MRSTGHGVPPPFNGNVRRRPTAVPSSEPLLRASRQTGKLIAVGVGFIGGAAALTFGDRLLRSSDIGWWVLAASAFVVIVAALYGFRSIRCPRCRTSWLHYALGELPFPSNFVGWLISFEECPKCGARSADLTSGSAV